MHSLQRRATLAALIIAPAAHAQDDHAGGVQAPPPPLGSTRAVSARASALLSNVAGGGTDAVPGLGGVTFRPGAGNTYFDRVYAHPTGHWVITAFADLPSDQDECLIRSGELVAREGSVAPWIPGGAELCGTLDQRCAVNSSGGFAFATNSSGTVDDDWIVTHHGGEWGHVAREGDPVPGLPGATLDDALDSCVLLDDGRAGYAADGIDGLGSVSVDDVLVLGEQVLMQEGVTIPAGQASGTEGPIENFDLGDFWTAADGSRWLVQGDLAGDTAKDDVVVVDGQVVLQEGVPVPASGHVAPISSGGVRGACMDASGAWLARGGNTGGHDWVVRNGSIVAETGAPLTPGVQERWDDAGFAPGFFAAAGNGCGSYVVGGVTDHADAALDAVLVLDGLRIIARESDPVDLDGDGAFDDGVFIDTFGDDDLALTEELRALCVVTLKDTTGARVGQALVSIHAAGGVGTPHCPPSVNSSGEVATLSAAGSLDAAADGLRLLLAGGPRGESAILVVGRDRGHQPGFGGTSGALCIAAPFSLLGGPGQVARIDGAGRACFAADPTGLPSGGALPGETWQFQGWFRDVDFSGAPSSNTSTAVEVQFL